jgi:hypothetical protein
MECIVDKHPAPAVTLSLSTLISATYSIYSVPDPRDSGRKPTRKRAECRNGVRRGVNSRSNWSLNYESIVKLYHNEPRTRRAVCLCMGREWV